MTFVSAIGKSVAKKATTFMNIAKGSGYGSVRVGEKLTLVPTKRLRRLTNNLDETLGFKWDARTFHTPQNTQAYFRRLGSLAKGKTGIKPEDLGNTSRFDAAHGWTQLSTITTNPKTGLPAAKPIVDIVEHLKNPKLEYLKFTFNKYTKKIGQLFSDFAAKIKPASTK